MAKRVRDIPANRRLTLKGVEREAFEEATKGSQ